VSAKKNLAAAARAAQREPESLVLRLKLAAALRAADRLHDALDVYRSVAVAYQREGRFLQALAVCRSILEIAPEDLETHVLLREVEAARTGAPEGEEPTRHDDGARRSALLPLPEVSVGPDEFDFDDGDEPTGPK
jgi:tetratricopeptide (TPR) repeat protein